MSDNIYQTPNSDLDLPSEVDSENYAGFWIRVAASIVDSILILLIILPALTWIYGMDYWLSDRLVSGGWDFFFNYILPAIAVLLFWLYRAATPGKMLFGLKIVSLGEQGKLSVLQAFGRYVGYYLSTIMLFAGFIWIAFDPKKQGWHDKLANTIVIKTR